MGFRSGGKAGMLCYIDHMHKRLGKLLDGHADIDIYIQSYWSIYIIRLICVSQKNGKEGW